jgi:CobQ-like glutamine amidotransferase family enzyme
MSQWFTIARVLPRTLGLNGSAANAEIVAGSLKALGHEVAVIDVHSVADVVTAVDLVCVGSGSGSSLRPSATEFIGLLRPLTQWASSGAWFFAVGQGWDLLGQHAVVSESETIPGAGILPSWADLRGGRFAGEVMGEDYRGRPCAGYVNQVGRSTLAEGVDALVSVSAAAGDFPATDGLVADRAMATRFGGPALALNPHWCVDIVTGLLAARGIDYRPTDFHERIEAAASRARAKIQERLASSPQ